MPHGPHVHLAPVNADEIVAEWRARRKPPVPADAPASFPKTRWWRRGRRHEAHS
jgi:hypothetical protein